MLFSKKTPPQNIILPSLSQHPGHMFLSFVCHSTQGQAFWEPTQSKC